MTETLAPFLVGMFLAGGQFRIYRRSKDRVTAEVLISVPISRAMYLTRIKYVFGGKTVITSRRAVWSTRNSQSIDKFCKALLPYESQLGPDLKRELGLIYEFVGSDGRGKRGEVKRQIMARRNELLGLMRRKDEGESRHGDEGSDREG